MDRIKVVVLGLVSLSLAGLFFTVPVRAGVRAAVSIPPQKYFVEKVGGDEVEVTVMVPPGASPHTYEPKPGQMAALAKADLYFTIGVEFEHTWADKLKAAKKDLVFIDTARKIERIPMQARPGHGSPGKGDRAKRRGSDPHIWLSPALVSLQAEAVRDGLVKADPARKDFFDRNLAVFKEEIRGLDEELRSAFEGLGDNKRILVFHPAWGYLCRDYGLTQVAVEKEGKEPTAKGLQLLIRQAEENGAKVVFVQPQFSSKAAATVAKALGGRVVPLDPLAPDWAENLRKAARQLREALY